jgi:RND family efflux transporter MFP subunit
MQSDEETVMIRLRWVLAFSALAALVLVSTGCGSGEQDEPPEIGIPVKTAAVVREAVSIPVHASGKLVSTTESRLSFKTGGIVGRIWVDEGEAVSGGQILAELETDEIEAQVEQARSGYDKAKRDFERVKRLFADSVATIEQFQNAETGLKLAESALAIAEFNLEHSAIRAPSDGRVLRRFVETDEMVGPGMPVVLFGTSGEGWRIRVGVSDRDIIRLRLGDPAIAAFDAYPGETFEAEVVEVGEAASPLSGAYEVELALRDEARTLVSGFVASVDIHPVRCDSMTVVPIEAVMEADGDEAYVYIPGESRTRARRLEVKVGCLTDAAVAVSSGLEGVETVITEGAAYLTDGAAIRIVE